MGDGRDRGGRAMTSSWGTTAMQKAFGYDDMGNAPHLLAEVDRAALDAGQDRRVSGDAICPICGSAYRVHPDVQGALWAKRGCEFLVKL